MTNTEHELLQRNSKSKCTGVLGPEFVNVSHSVPFSSIRGGGKGPRHIWLLYRFLKVYIFNVLHASKLFYILLTIGALVTDS